MAEFSLVFPRLRQAKKRTFGSVDDFKDWLETEHAAFYNASFVSSSRSGELVVHADRAAVIAKLLDDLNGEDDTQAVIKNLVDSRSFRNAYVLADTEDGAFLSQASERVSPETLGLIYRIIRGERFSQIRAVLDNHDSREAVVALHETGRHLAREASTDIAAQEKIAKDLVERLRKTTNHAKKSLQDVESDYAEAMISNAKAERLAKWQMVFTLAEILQTGKARYGRLRSAHRRAGKRNIDHLESARQEFVADMVRIRENYEEQMALRGPVQYWNGRATSHQKMEKHWGRILSGYLAVMFVIIAGIVIRILQQGAILDADDTSNTLLTLGAIAAGITVMFWGGRILSRLYLSRVHLRQSAAEKAVMAQTYLALTNENAATDADRAIMLATLFRPASDGMVKDDTAPNTSLQALIAGLLAGESRK